MPGTREGVRPSECRKWSHLELHVTMRIMINGIIVPNDQEEQGEAVAGGAGSLGEGPGEGGACAGHRGGVKKGETKE